MSNQPYISSTDEPTTFLNGKQLAETLDVSAPTLSEAAKNGYNCGGYPVSEWAEETGSGRIKGYYVPEFLVCEEATANQKSEKRSNPKPEASNKAQSSPNTLPNKVRGEGLPADWQAIINECVKGQSPQVEVQNPSILPKDQNYAEPVGMVSLASVLKKALEANTPESRMLIFASMMGFGGLVGHTVNDNGWGAAVGAVSSAGAMYVAYKWLTQPQASPNQPDLASENYKEIQGNPYFGINQSAFTN